MLIAGARRSSRLIIFIAIAATWVAFAIAVPREASAQYACNTNPDWDGCDDICDGPPCSGGPGTYSYDCTHQLPLGSWTADLKRVHEAPVCRCEATCAYKGCSSNGCACYDGGQCDSGFCKDNACASPYCPENGCTCYTGSQCNSGFCNTETDHCEDPPPPATSCEDQCQWDWECACVLCWGLCFEGGFCQVCSPVMIDLEAGGVDASSAETDYGLTSTAEGVWFDISAIGVRTRVAWTTGDASVGFLALDRNGNGAIDDGSELFGGKTPLRGGKLAGNGFVALAELDHNGDHRIDVLDPAYTRLRLWLDANHNAFSEPEELFLLPQVGVMNVVTSYVEGDYRDRHGNWYRYEGTAGMARGPGGVETVRIRIFDVLLESEGASHSVLSGVYRVILRAVEAVATEMDR